MSNMFELGKRAYYENKELSSEFLETMDPEFQRGWKSAYEFTNKKLANVQIALNVQPKREPWVASWQDVVFISLNPEFKQLLSKELKDLRYRICHAIYDNREQYTSMKALKNEYKRLYEGVLEIASKV